MVTKEMKDLIHEIFSSNPRIQRAAIIDLEGNVLIDQLSDSPNPLEINDKLIMFYYQIGLRRSRREYFNDEYGPVSYVHIIREKMQQMTLYLPMITVYLTIDKEVSPDDASQIANKIKDLDKDLISSALKSHLF